MKWSSILSTVFWTISNISWLINWHYHTFWCYWQYNISIPLSPYTADKLFWVTFGTALICQTLGYGLCSLAFIIRLINCFKDSIFEISQNLQILAIGTLIIDTILLLSSTVLNLLPGDRLERLSYILSGFGITIYLILSFIIYMISLCRLHNFAKFIQSTARISIGSRSPSHSAHSGAFTIKTVTVPKIELQTEKEKEKEKEQEKAKQKTSKQSKLPKNQTNTTTTTTNKKDKYKQTQQLQYKQKQKQKQNIYQKPNQKFKQNEIDLSKSDVNISNNNNNMAQNHNCNYNYNYTYNYNYHVYGNTTPGSISTRSNSIIINNNDLSNTSNSNINININSNFKQPVSTIVPSIKINSNKNINRFNNSNNGNERNSTVDELFKLMKRFSVLFSISLFSTLIIFFIVIVLMFIFFLLSDSKAIFCWFVIAYCFRTLMICDSIINTICLLLYNDIASNIYYKYCKFCHNNVTKCWFYQCFKICDQ